MSPSQDRIIEAVQAFVTADTWAGSKQIVEANRDVLLTDAANEVFADLLEQYKDNENATRILEEHHALLLRCRSEGIDAAFAELVAPGDPSTAVPESIVEAVLAFANARTWAESKQMVEARRDVLLTDAADGVLANLLTQYKEDENATRILGQRRALLARCRREGIEAAFADLVPQSPVEVVLAFVNAQTWTESKQIAEAHRDVLLTNTADEVLVTLLEQYEDNEDATRQLEEHRALLARCYCKGIDAAFADRLPPPAARSESELGTLLQELGQLTKPGDMPQAVAVCQAALELVSRDSQPELWAALQGRLGNSLAQNPLGDRAQNIEDAIEHYELALQVYTRQDFPEQWATTQNNLATAYSDRIRGDRAQNIEDAIEHYELALQVRTPTTFPQDCRNTAYSLGNLLYNERRFPEARTPFTTAHEAVEALRSEIQREGARRDLAEQNAALYARLVHCCLLRDDEEAAFKYAVAGKGRAFVDMLATARFNLSAAGADDPELAEDLRKAQKLRQQIDNLWAQLRGEGGLSTPDGTERRSPVDMRADLRALQDQEDTFWEYMAYRHPSLTATQQAPALTAQEARGLAGMLRASW
ncbi:MAG: hypothetical protein QOI57_2001 [Rubrobacteraceae bacterium]|nr:hypothetical protein [Rubrobacteraceae bacterium]